MDPMQNSQVMQMLNALMQGQGAMPQPQGTMPGMDAQSQQASLGNNTGIGLQQNMPDTGAPQDGGLSPDAAAALLNPGQNQPPAPMTGGFNG